jgi:hypothetical protein
MSQLKICKICEFSFKVQYSDRQFKELLYDNDEIERDQEYQDLWGSHYQSNLKDYSQQLCEVCSIYGISKNNPRIQIISEGFGLFGKIEYIPITRLNPPEK